MIGHKHMSLLNKVKEMISNPISVSYKEKKEYSKLDMIVLNPIFLFLLVASVTCNLFSSRNLDTGIATECKST